MMWRRARAAARALLMAMALLLLLLLLCPAAASSAASSAAEETPSLARDARALQSFLANLAPTARVPWPAAAAAAASNGSSSGSGSKNQTLTLNPCTWQGVQCTAGEAARVRALRLPGRGLDGEIAEASLGLLSELQVLSLRSNKLGGNLPQDLSNCTQLRAVYLQRNRIAGELPLLAGSAARLLILDLSANNFSGAIPEAYAAGFGRLKRLRLSNNSLSGGIPDAFFGDDAEYNVSRLEAFDVSNNKGLGGAVPAAWEERFGAAAFAGTALCGPPLLPQCPAAAPAPAPTTAAATSGSGSGSGMPTKKRSIGRLPAMTAIAVAAAVAGAIVAASIVAMLTLLYSRRRKRRDPAAAKQKAGHKEKKDNGGAAGLSDSAKDEFSSAAPEMDHAANRLVFLGPDNESDAAGTGTGNGRFAFDLEDLLRASAEVLGKGSAGTSYKAVLEDGTTVVVKRLRDVALGRRDFQLHMDALAALGGGQRHLLPLRAFYYSKDEKLLLYDYMPLGSLSAALHGNKGLSRPTPLDWSSRLRIAAGVARGIAHLHDKAGPKLAHGNLKSSNVLLSPGHRAAATSDYGLAPVFGPAGPAASRIVGYRAPEVAHARKATHKSDVYSFGVLLLELLTGRAPGSSTNNHNHNHNNNHNNGHGDGLDLPTWVQSVVREEWTSEVFDAELTRQQPGGACDDELVDVLQIAMACVAASPDQRPSMAQVVKMIDDVRRASDASDDDDDDDASDGDGDASDGDGNGGDNGRSQSDKSKDSNGAPLSPSPSPSPAAKIPPPPRNIP